ncbi:Golgi-associated plant pathogenesis-related protein 1-like [Argiope bruennichi]|uniref:Golgi-associated plant pathogenesis-related protein 1-like n=1 Tax=Argiope bruennichi TaxID=94029 RepID=UPI002493ECD9|nr:Golgi-associated plant pathogenesis-related protein 1-like [Argiope bruennichi]
MMDCLLQKLKGLRASKVESPKYRRQRTTVRGDKTSLASTSDTSSYYSASSNFIDRVILGRHIYIQGNAYELPDFATSEFVVDCLHWHNVFREKHDVPPLQLNNQLCTQAQFWANHLAHTNTFSHRNLRDIGENLFSKWSYIPDFDITAQQVTKYWYEEIKTYNFFQDPSLLHVKAGHFTQMVWRSSTEFGVGKARSRCGKVIVVANYKPSGNVIGEFQDNVFPPVNDMDILNEI